MNRRTFLKGMASSSVAGPMFPGRAMVSAAASLKSFAAQKGLLFGSCFALKYAAASPQYEELFLSQCDIATPEVHMKWNSMSTAQGIYNFDQADKFVAFCAGHRIAVRGHTLVWHDALPEWVLPQLAQGNGWMILSAHIDRVATHFAGKLYSWDVVNEILDPASHHEDSLRQTPWLQSCGPSYVEESFRCAAKADPKALLIWNVNYLELSNSFGKAKRAAMLKLLDRWLDRAVPIHGIGLEAHLRADQAALLGDTSYEVFLQELAKRGMQIFVTELDVQDDTLSADATARDRCVAEIYARFLRATLSEPAVRGVLTWGLADRFTWIAGYRPRKDSLPVRPLPFDSECEPKAAYYAIAEAMQNAPPRGEQAWKLRKG